MATAVIRRSQRQTKSSPKPDPDPQGKSESKSRSSTSTQLRRCLLCSAMGSNVFLDEDEVNSLCQEMEAKGQVISCGDDGLTYMSQLDGTDTQLFCDALHIELGEDLQEFRPTFCSTKCFQTVARLTSIQLELQKLVNEVIAQIIDSISSRNKNELESEADVEEIKFERKIFEQWSQKCQELVSHQASSEKSVIKEQTVIEETSSKCKDRKTTKNLEYESSVAICPSKRRKNSRSDVVGEMGTFTDSRVKNEIKAEKKGYFDLEGFRCDICQKPFKTKKSCLAHKQETHKDEKTQCPICGIIFRTLEFYNLHLDHIHSVLTQDYSKINKNEQYKCKYCQRGLRSISSLKTHLHAHIRKKPAACPICQRVLNNDVDFHYHKKVHDGPFDCDMDECRKRFQCLEELNLHRADEHKGEGDDPNFVQCECSVCGLAFTTMDNLNEHEKVHPSVDNSKLFRCELCGEIFGVKYYLHRHLATEHRVPEHLERFDTLCHLCGKNFTLRKCLLVHMKTHLQQHRFPCKHCSKEFSSRHGLKQHEAVEHEGVQNIFKCNYCTDTFTFLIASRRHMVEDHPQHTEIDQHFCKVCYKTFPVLSLLQGHLKGHEKLTCKVCGKALGSKRRLEMHEAIHTGDFKFSCDICGKRFRHDNNVQSHKKEQHGDMARPWICVHCPNKSYKRKEHLRNHMQREHEKDLEVKKKRKTTAEPKSNEKPQLQLGGSIEVPEVEVQTEEFDELLVLHQSNVE